MRSERRRLSVGAAISRPQTCDPAQAYRDAKIFPCHRRGRCPHRPATSVPVQAYHDAKTIPPAVGEGLAPPARENLSCTYAPGRMRKNRHCAAGRGKPRPYGIDVGRALMGTFSIRLGCGRMISAPTVWSGILRLYTHFRYGGVSGRSGDRPLRLSHFYTF